MSTFCLSPTAHAKDHLGSVREVTDGAGVLRARYDYGFWGNRTRLSGDVETAVGYTGHHHHGKTGLVLTWYRAYDPDTGRWLSRDPLGEPGFEVLRRAPALDEVQKVVQRLEAKAAVGDGANLYSYVRNNPVNQVDPLGLVSLPPGWHGPGQPYDPSSNPFCGPPPRCSQAACKAGCAAAALYGNVWVCDFIKEPRAKAICKTAVGGGLIACVLACNLCPDP